MQPRLDVEGLAEEVARLIVAEQEDERLKRYEDGRVRVLVGKVLPRRSVVKQTLASRRKRFRAALRTRLVEEGSNEAAVNVYRKKGQKKLLNNAEIASKMS